MTSTRIDVPTVLEDLQAIVAEHGDGFVYQPPAKGAECVYRVNDQPSCIIGHLFARHGLLGRTYSADNVALRAEGIHASNQYLFERDFTPDAVVVMAVAQSVQDSLVKTWGDALIAAKQAAENLEGRTP